MQRNDLRFYCPLNREDELALVRTRVRERREGLKLTARLFGGCALASAALAFVACLDGVMANLMPTIVVLVALPAAGLAIVAISSLIWRGRLRRLAAESDSTWRRIAA